MATGTSAIRFSHQLVFTTIFLIFLLSCQEIFTQSVFKSTTFTTSDGLINNEVNDICHDRTGFLWIATWEGVSRFDGYEFRNYYADLKQDTGALGYHVVDRLLCDSNNNLLALSPLVIYNRAQDRFERYKINGRNVEGISDMTIDQKGRLWLLGTDSLYIGEGVGKPCNTYRFVDNHGNKVPMPFNSQFTIDNKGVAWFITGAPKGVSVFRGVRTDNVTFTLFLVDILNFPNVLAFPSGTYYHLQVYINDKSEIWLATRHGLFHSPGYYKPFTEYEGKAEPHHFQGIPSLIWMNVKTGLNVILPDRKQHLQIPAPANSYFITAVYDPSGTIWSAAMTNESLGTGLTRHTQVPVFFKHYLTNCDKPGETNLVFPITQDCNGNTWVGMRGKPWLTKISPDGVVSRVKYAFEPYGRKFPQARSLLADSTGIWIGCMQEKLYYYNFKSETCEQHFNTVKNHNPRFLLNLQKKGDTVYFIGENGLYGYHLKTRQIIAFYPFRPDRFAATLITDSHGHLWAGYNCSVLNQYDHWLNIIRRDSFGNQPDIVEHICPGRNNDIWVALQGGGLGHIELKTRKTELLTTADGLANNTLWSLVMDKKGLIWISTNKGISCFNPVTRKFRNFGAGEGLAVHDFNADSYYCSDNGEIFFGGVGGMVSFHPLQVSAAFGKAMPLVITDLAISGNAVHSCRPLYESDTVILSKGANNIQVAFACLDLQNAMNIKYRYRLTGLDESWRVADQRSRKAAFYNLRPGQYRFEVTAADKNVDWVSQKSLTLIIPYRFHETTWFRLIMTLSIVLFIGFIVHLYIRQIRLKSRHMLDALRLEALRTQMNPHFIFNSLNSINMFISRNDKIAANSYISDFSRLIRSFLTNLSGEYIPIEDEFSLLKNYLSLERLRFNDQFTFSLELAQSLIGSGYCIFPGIIQPFVENAIWHGFGGLEGRNGNINIRCFLDCNRTLKCIIEDDGIGRKRSIEKKDCLPGKKSRGISIVTERLELMNRYKRTNYRVVVGDLYSDKEDAGTRIEIDIPYITIKK